MLLPGSDLRESRWRRDVFLRFYGWALRYRSHPGGVYYALPRIADALGLDEEQRYWLAWLNGNTQNPVTTLLLLQEAPAPRDADRAVAFWNRHFAALRWDTDRRHHKARFGDAMHAYLGLTGGGRYFPRNSDWPDWWRAASGLPYLGRLSAWSYLEYLRILGLPVPDADTLMLDDRSGSRSHRNGLALVAGMDEWIWWDRNPGFDGRYPPEVVSELEKCGAALLSDTEPHPDAGYLTLESALCTYKSWHRPNRRYPGVYNDLLHDRIVHGEIQFGRRFGILWDARRNALPEHLRLEDVPADPGCVPLKQNWYLEHGETVSMGREDPVLHSSFDDKVDHGDFGLRRQRWI